jgi:hypothetical protein
VGSAFQQRESQEDLFFSPSSSCFYFLGSPPQGCGRRGAVITTHTISFTGASVFLLGLLFLLKHSEGVFFSIILCGKTDSLVFGGGACERIAKNDILPSSSLIFLML